jgi:hypothetical protein
MTKYPLEWGWDQPNNEKSSTSTEWKPKPTLLGSHDGDVDIAAVGDLRCDGIPGGGGCANKGDRGSTAMYGFDAGKMCAKCAVRYIGAEDLPSSEQTEMLRPFLLPGR